MNGVTADGLEAAATPAFTVIPRVLGVPTIFDVTNEVRSWVAGTATNRGWALLAATVDGWVFRSSEWASTSLRPALEITFAASVLEFSQPVYSIDEGAVTATISVTRTGWTGGAVTVQYATADGTATAGADYTAAAGTLSWPAADTTSRTFTVPILADALVEADETVLLTLTNPTGAATLSPRSTATLTIKETAFNNWLVAHFAANANTPGIAGWNADPDGDSHSNRAEYLADTDPLDPASVFLIRGIGPIAGGWRITFPTATGRTYRVEWSSDLAQWFILADNIAGTGANVEVDDLTAPPQQQRMYRIVVHP